MINRNQVISKLAQAILDVQQADGNAALNLVLAQLNADLGNLRVSPNYNAALPGAVLDPALVELETYYDQLGTPCAIPKGYKMVVAFVTDLVWPETFSIENDRPVYESTPGKSGAPYVDLWLVRVPGSKMHPSTMEAFKALLMEDGYMIKTRKEFNPDTSEHSIVLRVMERHDKFCTQQQITLPQQ